MSALDPYDINEVVAACADHAWANPQRAQEFRDHGINSRDEVVDHIWQSIDGHDTRAFSCQPQARYGQSFQREVYNAPFNSPIANKPYETTIVFDPNRREDGRVVGGSCWIRSAEKNELQRMARDEKKNNGLEPTIVQGGRPALREQQAHQQIRKVDELAEHVHQQASPHELQFFEDKPKQAQPEAAPVKETGGLQFYEDSIPSAPNYTIKR